MNRSRTGGSWLLVAAVSCLGIPSAAQPIKPETQRDFDCYVQGVEARLAARKAFLLAGADESLNQRLTVGRKVETLPANGANPHKLAGGQLYDWTAAIFIPGVRLNLLIQMLQDYDRRPQFFPETIATSKLLCRTGENRFRYSMRLKEPAAIDVESDVVWERVDAQRWRCRSLSTKVSEVGKDHGYLRRLYSWWRFAETDRGVYVESETITLSDEFGAMTRALGSMLMGINPEKSLRHSMASMRESVLKPGLTIPAQPAGWPDCGAALEPAGCAAATLPTGK